MKEHPTQVFMSNPRALRVEYCLDDECLKIWWSPLAGISNKCEDRNYSSRDAHLNVFESISFTGCGLDKFTSCSYDPYHCILYFKDQALHFALRPDIAAVFVWGEKGLAIDIKTERHDKDVVVSQDSLVMRHREPRFSFEFSVHIGTGDGKFRHSHIREPENCRFARAELAANQLIVIAVGLAGDKTTEIAKKLAVKPPETHISETNAILEQFEKMGHVSSFAHPDLECLRRKVVRGLHSMIDDSGAFRASLKAIYYLIWVRDSGFSFAYQTAAGLPHRLRELCRFLLDNPTYVNEPGLPKGRIFAQLINSRYGKLEEDGLFYVVWALFMYWTQNGNLDFMTSADWDLIYEALEWIEKVCWDDERKLYGEHFADETPTKGHRDSGYDYAIGMPTNIEWSFLTWKNVGVVRNYDVYFNTLMHSVYVMLAAMRSRLDLLRKGERVLPELLKLLNMRNQGVPIYAEQLLENGERVLVAHWGQAISCCVWGLTIPNFVPLPDWDTVLANTMDALIAKPEMHFMNGICSAMSAVDTWLYPEEKLISLHKRIAEETNRSGKYLPMGGAMPEKFGAPEGNIYHDIRPQGFAMGAWLSALSSLGLRRLPYGLAFRPTKAFERISKYLWQGALLDIEFGHAGSNLAIEIDGKIIYGTLQIPEKYISEKDQHKIRLVSDTKCRPLLLRSHVRLDYVEEKSMSLSYYFTAFGVASLTFSQTVKDAILFDDEGKPIPHRWVECNGLHTCYFEHFGKASISISADF